MSEDFSVDELLKNMSETYQETAQKVGHCNVLVIGKTGVGKSTLINTIFQSRLAETGVGYPVTQYVRRYTKTNCPITIYDTPGLELGSKQIEKVRLDVSELIEKQRQKEAKEQVHIVWYCINHEGHKLEDVEEEWLKSLALKDIPIILVLTQTLTKKRSEFQAFLDSKNLPVCQIIPILAVPKPIDDDYTVKVHGLERLVEVTAEQLPEEARKAFLREQKRNIELKTSEAFKYLSGYIAGSALVGASPIPFSDAPLLVMMQTAMITNITAIFGLPFDLTFIKTVVSAIGGSLGLAAAGRAIAANLLKMIPGAGTAIGGVISASTAAALTLALGLAYIGALKIYVKAQNDGKDMPLSELANIILNLYKYYARTGQNTPMDDHQLALRQIDIE